MEELHIVGGVDVTSAITLNTSDRFFGAVWSSVPTLSGLDASEIGVFRHAGNTNATTIEDVWLQVDYTTGVPAAQAGGAGKSRGKRIWRLILPDGRIAVFATATEYYRMLMELNGAE